MSYSFKYSMLRDKLWKELSEIGSLSTNEVMCNRLCLMSSLPDHHYPREDNSGITWHVYSCVKQCQDNKCASTKNIKTKVETIVNMLQDSMARYESIHNDGMRWGKPPGF